MSKVEYAVLPTGIRLAYERFGQGPPVLLIMGLGSQMLLWPDDFCAMLANEGYSVIRFDNRDVGLSTRLHHLPTLGRRSLLRAGLVGGHLSPAYTLTDMAADAVCLLDHLDLPSAHIVGASLGGAIAQQLALTWPGRCKSLCVLMSTPDARRFRPRPRALGVLVKRRATTAEETIEQMVQVFLTIGSQTHPPDVAHLRQVAKVCFERGVAGSGYFRHLAAMIASGDRSEALAHTVIPTAVIHGTQDPLIPVEAGRALHKAMPSSTYQEYDQMGHDLPLHLWPSLVQDLRSCFLRAK